MFIIRKGREWLKSSRPDLLEIPYAHLFSGYLYDAKEFETRKEALRTAKRIGGEVWRFFRVTGKRELVWTPPPKDAKCDNCRKYTGYDGSCKNPESEYYKVPVSLSDVCDEWSDVKEVMAWDVLTL